MSSRFDLLELECDAPPYAIVRACRKLGMKAPEDVRWCRKSRHGKRHHGWISFLANPIWGRLLGRAEGEGHACTCGQALPELESYAFTFQSGESVEYDMGQCVRCRTIYWEKV